MDCTVASNRQSVSKSVLLLAAFGLVSAMPMVPFAWFGPMAAAALVVTIMLVITRDRQAACLSLFCAIMPAAAIINPWRFWPMHLLVPLIAYAALIGAIGWLRQGLILPPTGRFDRWTIGLVALTVVGSSAALVLWYALAQPDVSDFRREVPPWPAWTLPLTGLGVAIINAIMEEALWRWILWDLLKRAIPVAPLVILLQAGSFGLAHIHGFPRGWIGVAMAGLYGLVLGWIRHRAGGLGPPIVAHIFADAVIFAVLVFTPNGVNNRLWEAGKLKKQAWEVVSSPGGEIEAYRLALGKAEMANRLKPNELSILPTLGIAQYRVGAYQDALTTLIQLEKMRADAHLELGPPGTAFMAMALHQLGRAEDAQATLDQLRDLCKDKKFAENKTFQGFLSEAEKLIAGKEH